MNSTASTLEDVEQNEYVLIGLTLLHLLLSGIMAVKQRTFRSRCCGAQLDYSTGQGEETAVPEINIKIVGEERHAGVLRGVSRSLGPVRIVPDSARDSE